VTAQAPEDPVSQPATATVIAATTQLTGVAITGTPQVGDTLTANVMPSNVAVNYQWQESTAENGTYATISGATAGAYTPVQADVNKYIEVTATGTGNFNGTVTSAAVGPVAAAPVVLTGGGGGPSPVVKTKITAVAITGTPQVGDTLTAGSVTPFGATVSYQWEKSSTQDGTYQPISGATSSTYTLTASDQGQYLEVVATGTGDYSGTATSMSVGPVAAATIQLTGVSIAVYDNGNGTETLTAGLNPSNATANYQWQNSKVEGGPTTAIGTNSNIYTTEQYGWFQVIATGSGNFSGVVSSEPVRVTPFPD
jgi:broad-specificity NMP kinase